MPNLGVSESAPQFVPNFRFLKDQFGDAEVQVADCARREFTDQPRIGMRFAELVERWEVMGRRGESERNVDEDESRYYLKDWHFVKAYPDYGAYETPDIFCGMSSPPSPLFSCVFNIDFNPLNIPYATFFLSFA